MVPFSPKAPNYTKYISPLPKNKPSEPIFSNIPAAESLVNVRLNSPL